MKTVNTLRRRSKSTITNLKEANHTNTNDELAQLRLQQQHLLTLVLVIIDYRFGATALPSVACVTWLTRSHLVCLDLLPYTDKIDEDVAICC